MHKFAGPEPGDRYPETLAESPGPDAEFSEQRAVERLFQLSPDLLCVAGFDGYFRLVNSAWEHTLGYNRKHLLSYPYLDFVHPGDVESTRMEMAAIANGATCTSFENRCRREDGAYVWLEWTAFPQHKDKLVYAIARDVTGRRQLQEDLEKSHRLLTAVLRHTRSGVLHLEAQRTSGGAPEDFLVRLASPAAEEILGQPRHVLEGRRLWEQLPEGSDSRLHAMFEQVADSRAGEYLCSCCRLGARQAWTRVIASRMGEGLAVILEPLGAGRDCGEGGQRAAGTVPVICFEERPGGGCR